MGVCAFNFISVLILTSVLCHCWLGGREGIRPVKTELWGAGVVISVERGADLHMAQRIPLPLTVSVISEHICFLLLVFLFLHFLFVGSVRWIKLTHVGFRAHVNIASLIVSFLASVKSRLVLPFWYRLTRVVPDRGPLNGCVCVCLFCTMGRLSGPCKIYVCVHLLLTLM